jgi:hypothetical protein
MFALSMFCDQDKAKSQENSQQQQGDGEAEPLAFLPLRLMFLRFANGNIPSAPGDDGEMGDAGCEDQNAACPEAGHKGDVRRTEYPGQNRNDDSRWDADLPLGGIPRERACADRTDPDAALLPQVDFRTTPGTIPEALHWHKFFSSGRASGHCGHLMTAGDTP